MTERLVLVPAEATEAAIKLADSGRRFPHLDHCNASYDPRGACNCGAASANRILDRLAMIEVAPQPPQISEGELRATLEAAKAKLKLYRDQHSGEYIGGMEYTALIKRIDAALVSQLSTLPHGER